MEEAKVCVVCGYKLAAYLRDVPARNNKKSFPLYFCLHCESFFNPSGFVPSEKEEESELEFHIKVEQRNFERSRALLKKIRKCNRRLTSIVEIGCSTGVMIKVAQDIGLKPVGFDINSAAIAYGRNKFGCDLRSELWEPSKSPQEVDLFLCIMVLEHIEKPRDLFFLLAAAAKQKGAKLFVSVPFLDRDRWRYLFNPDPLLEETPFFNNEIHVTHFSKLGLRTLALQAGATQVSYIRSRLPNGELGWGGYLIDFSTVGITSKIRRWFLLTLTNFSRKIVRVLESRYGL